MPSTRLTLEPVEDALASGAVSIDPHTTYHYLRDVAPVYWSAYLEQWLITPAALVEDALMQPNRFSNFGYDSAFIARLGGTTQAFPILTHHFEAGGLIISDPPEHTRLRRAVRGPFSAHSVDRLADLIQDRLDGLLDGLGERFDVMADIARPLTVSVISDLLGVPEEDREHFPTWSYDVIRFFGTPRPTVENAAILDAALAEWRALLVRLFAERLARPTDDLLSHVAAQVDQGDVSLEEALFTCVHLMIGGHETTTSTVGTTLLCLLTDPASYAAVAGSPDLVPGAIEEAIRLETPVMRARRLATEDCEIDGVEIKAGEAVVPIFASANRDPARFEHPDVFDLERPSAGRHHYAFGRGTHFCLGAPLARLEAQITVKTLLRRYPELRLPAGFAPQWKPSLSIRALESLPLEVTAPRPT